MKKTTLILSLLLAVLVTATAQTTFTDAVKAYTRACPASLVDMKTKMADNPEMTKECGLLLVMSYLNWLTNQGVKLKDLE